MRIFTEKREAAPSPPLPHFLSRKPWATRITFGLVAVVSLAALYDPSLLDLLAKENDGIRAGEFWRLFTPGLVHGSVMHLVMNGLFLLSLGGLVERLFGPLRMLAILWGGVATGVTASFFASERPSVGISGGLFALVGALFAQGALNWKRITPPARRMFIRGPIEVVVLNLALGLALPFIDNAGHLGGLAGGLLLGAIAGMKPEVLAIIAPAPRPPASPWAER